MKADPAMKRRRGKFVCAECGKELNEVTIRNEDPFCSAGCANTWHDFHPPSTTTTLGRGHQGGGRKPKYDTSLRPRAGETAQQTLDRVVRAVRKELA